MDKVKWGSTVTSNVLGFMAESKSELSRVTREWKYDRGLHSTVTSNVLGFLAKSKSELSRVSREWKYDRC